MNRQISTLLSLVHPIGSSRIALCLIPPSTSRDATSGTEHRFTRVDEVTRFLSYARYRNAQGWGIYITPSVLKPMASNRCKESFEDRQQIIYVDCDQPACIDRIRTRYPFPALVVRTSKGRHQVYWRLEHPVTVLQQEQLMSQIAGDIDADRAATDVSRVFRLPGFWNRKPNRHNTVDIVFTRHQTVNYTSLCQAVQHWETAPDFTALPTSTRGSSSCVSECFRRRQPSRDGISESERDWYEVHRRLAVGCEPDEVIQWLKRKRQDKRNPQYYAEHTVRKAIASRSQTM